MEVAVNEFGVCTFFLEYNLVDPLNSEIVSNSCHMKTDAIV